MSTDLDKPIFVLDLEQSLSSIYKKEIILAIFRPPFINGRPQETVLVFWRKKALVPVFEAIFPLFSFASFFEKESPGVSGGDWGIGGHRTMP